MTELERNLVALGRELDYPPEPDLTVAVSDRAGASRRTPSMNGTSGPYRSASTSPVRRPLTTSCRASASAYEP